MYKLKLHIFINTPPLVHANNDEKLIERLLEIIIIIKKF